MIEGTGIDIVQVHRMEKWIKTPSLLERFFHEDELSVFLERGKGAARFFAARFAAKEAFVKALGTGFAGIALKDISVKNMDNGRPVMQVYGTALAAMNQTRAACIHLSLSHEKDNAIAMVILESRP